jgi:folylpolyglutamate synthase/dihydropteroate synthase
MPPTFAFSTRKSGKPEYLCDDLEAIANEKGGIGQMLYDKWCKVYNVLPVLQAVATA